MKNGIFVLVFLASALTRIFLLGSAPERLVKSLGQGLTGTVFRDQIYENENGNRYDLYIPAGLDRMQDQNLTFHGSGALDFQSQKINGKLKRFRFYGICQIDDVGRMYDEFFHAVLMHGFPSGVDI